MHNIVKRHLAQVDRSYRRFQRKVGQTVVWYEFNPVATTMHAIYDEGPSRQWLPGKVVPTLNLTRDEDREAPREEGLYTGGSIHVIISARQAAEAGMSDPHNSRLHLNDRFLWDGELWDVRRFQVSGRLITNEVVIGVDAQRVSSEEMVNDTGFPRGPVSFTAFSTSAWRALGYETFRQLSESGLTAGQGVTALSGEYVQSGFGQDKFGQGGFGE